MKKIGVKAAVWVVLATPATMLAQRSGVSHPEEIPVTTSPEGIGQPVVYETVQAPATVVVTVANPELKNSELKPRVALVAEPVLTAAAVAPVVTPTNDDVRRPLPIAANVDGQIVERVEGPANELPAGAMLKVRMLQELSSNATAAGTAFTAELVSPAERDGRILLPAGSLIKGRVTEVHGGKRISGAASIHLLPTSVTLPDGTIYPLHAQVIDTDRYRKSKVDSEGTILRSDHAKGTIAAVGLATGSGAAAGAMLGGWPGALIGAGVSAGISTVVWLRQDHQTELPAGTGVTLQLNSPLAVGLR